MATQLKHDIAFTVVSGTRYVVLTLVRPFGAREVCRVQRKIPAGCIACYRRERDFLATQWRSMREQIVDYRFKNGVPAH